MVRWKFLAALFFVIAIVPFSFGQKPDLTPNSNVNQVATITFTFDFPGALPPHYSLAVESTGKATYLSTPSSDQDSGDPYEVHFVVSEPTRTRLFDLAKSLNFFNGDFDYKKGKIAFTGTKTIDFKDGIHQNHTVYNWSDNMQLREVTSIFQNISETLEYGRELAKLYRFDKLGVDAELRKMIDAGKSKRLMELQAIQPILSKIANDPGMMNIARRRAQNLLGMIPAAPATTASAR